MRIFVTGTSGFIGYHFAQRLLADGHQITGFDALTPYYDVALKRARQDLLARHANFISIEAQLEDMSALRHAWGGGHDIVLHLAAQAGVRYSIEHPRAYLDANVTGTFNLLEAVRDTPPRHFLFASTSSVYGANLAMPFRETDRTDHPLTVYAATKKATEVLSHATSHIRGLPVTALRFFTVYGPWGRPDMAPMRFARAILGGAPIDVYNHGNMKRDFTFIDDLVEAMVRLIPAAPVAGEGCAPVDSLSPVAPWRAVNIGRGAPVDLMDFIATLETALGRKAVLNMMPMQQGDVPATFANADLLEKLTGFRPSTPLAAGVASFARWYLEWAATA